MSDLQHERLAALELRLPALPNLYGAVAQNFALNRPGFPGGDFV
jgi:hypothetical protein